MAVEPGPTFNRNMVEAPGADVATAGQPVALSLDNLQAKRAVGGGERSTPIDVDALTGNEDAFKDYYYSTVFPALRTSLEASPTTAPFDLHGRYGVAQEVLSGLSRYVVTVLGTAGLSDIVSAGEGPLNADLQQRVLETWEREHAEGKFTGQAFLRAIEDLKRARAFINSVRLALKELAQEFTSAGKTKAASTAQLLLDGDSRTIGLDTERVREGMKELKSYSDLAIKFAQTRNFNTLPQVSSTANMAGYVDF